MDHPGRPPRAVREKDPETPWSSITETPVRLSVLVVDSTPAVRVPAVPPLSSLLVRVGISIF